MIDMKVNSYMNGVSIILCCHNSAIRLPETLRHLARQIVPDGIPWEVLVIDNASTDGTREVAIREWSNASEAISLRVVSEPKAGLSYARERGIESASYELLLFCDDDNWLCSSYVARVYQILHSNPEVSLIGGWGDPICEVTPPKWFGDFSGPYGTGPQGNSAGIAPPLATFYGAGTALRKSHYLELVSNGFQFILSGRQGSKLTTGEDRELCYALTLSGRKLYYDPSLKFRHFIPQERSTFLYYRRMTENCVPASIILKCYHLHVLNRIKVRPQWKNSHSWITAMMVWSQSRKAMTCLWPYLKNGYWNHSTLEVRLIFKTLWIWLRSRRQFRLVYQKINKTNTLIFKIHNILSLL